MYVDLYYRRLQHSNVDSFDAGFGFLLPFFDRSQGRIREAKANKAAAQATVRSTQLELEAQLRSAHARLVTSLATARVLREEILPNAERVLAAAERRYKAGDTSLGEVLPVRRERTAFELAYVEALREALEAWASLLPFVAAGGA
jgi:outer membrane protein, heavy metal efflux system